MSTGSAESRGGDGLGGLLAAIAAEVQGEAAATCAPLAVRFVPNAEYVR